MEVKPGYKQTEIGVIPDDWEARRIDSACRLINGRGFKPYEWQTTGLPIIRIQNLNGSEEFNYFRDPYEKKLEVEPGQLLFAWSGSRGTSFGPHIWNGPLGLLNYHTWKVQVFIGEVFKDFLLHALRRLTKFIEEKAHGASALVHTQKWEMESFLFPLPPTRAEQEAIAGALSDADALIESLEQLVAKKRQIKHGAMQELLTGQKRLPGFTGAWGTKRIGEVAEVKTGPFGSALHERDYVQDGTPIITVEHLGILGVTHSNLPLVSETDRKRLSAYSLQLNDIVFSRVGSVDRNALIRDPEAGWLFSGRLLRLRFDQKTVFAPFLSHYFHTEPFKERVRSVAVGQTMASLNTRILSGVMIHLPSLPEQSAIASILSDMDTEISALEAKLTKARQVKQGMMQELLTGRIRLV